MENTASACSMLYTVLVKLHVEIKNLEHLMVTGKVEVKKPRGSS